MLSAITREDAPPIGDLVSGVPPRLARLLARMLARERERRPELDEVREELGALLAGAPAVLAPKRGRWLLLPGLALLAGAGVAFGRSDPPVGPRPEDAPAGSLAPSHSPVAALSEVPEAGTSAAPFPSVVAPATTAPSARADPLPTTSVRRLRPSSDAGSPAPSASGIILTHDRK